MEEIWVPMTKQEATVHERIGKIITAKYSDKIYSPTIITDVINELHPDDHHATIEETVRVAVGNRQLMAENFK